MKKIVLLMALFLSLQVSLYAQTYYINGTTDASSGNQSLIHNNELKIGNSTSTTERAKNMIKIGDGSYIQIGEWEADNLLSFKASKFNFTNGYVGIGTTAPTALLDVNGSIKAASLSLTGTLSAGGLTSTNGLFNSYGRKNLYLQTNGVNRMTVLSYSGYVGIGTTAPAALLDVNGSMKAASLSLTGTLSAGGLTSTNGQFGSDGTSNLFLQTDGTNRMTVLNSNGYVGIGTASPNSLLEISGNNPAFTLRGTPTRLEIGVPSANQNYAPYSRRGDVVFRPLSGVDGHVGLIFNIPVDNADGNCYIKFGDEKNHGWFSLYNNKIAVINGKLGIGTENPTHALEVKGIIRAVEVKIESSWADFVFNDDYHLKPLSEVNRFIKENKHLPEIPSATEVRENEGVNLGEMQVKLLQKIEELTLYLIQQESTIRELKDKIEKMENR
jgi:hypothetical protein